MKYEVKQVIRFEELSQNEAQNVDREQDLSNDDPQGTEE